jgi:hypothetical protein
VVLARGSRIQRPIEALGLGVGSKYYPFGVQKRPPAASNSKLGFGDLGPPIGGNRFINRAESRNEACKTVFSMSTLAKLSGASAHLFDHYRIHLRGGGLCCSAYNALRRRLECCDPNKGGEL